MENRCNGMHGISVGSPLDVRDVLDFLKKYLPERCDFYPFENADHRFKKPGELEQIIKITKDIMIG